MKRSKSFFLYWKGIIGFFGCENAILKQQKKFQAPVRVSLMYRHKTADIRTEREL